MCDDGLSVSRQNDRCGGRAKGAFRGESAAVSRAQLPLAGCSRLFLLMVLSSPPGLAHLEKRLATALPAPALVCCLSFPSFPLFVDMSSVLGATSLSTSTPKPSIVCCPVETCNSLTSLTFTNTPHVDLLPPVSGALVSPQNPVNTSFSSSRSVSISSLRLLCTQQLFD